MKHLLALLSVGLLSACTPTCQQVCNKLDRCEFDTTISANACQQSCEQQLLFSQDRDDDDATLKEFNEHRRCIESSTCDELEAGECVLDDVFAVDE